MLSPLSLSQPPLRVARPTDAARAAVPPLAVPAPPADSRPELSREVARICAAVSVRQRVRRGELVARAGQRFESLVWVGSGLLMSTAMQRGAAGRTVDFHLPGEIVGLHSIADGVHPFDVRVLEDSALRLAPFALLEQLANAEPQLLQALHRLLSRELLRGQRLAMVLAVTSAEARLAAFLADFWQRRREGAAHHGQVVLSMGRADIGSHLGLTMESISRSFARLARRGLIDVRRRRLRIVDIAGLQALAAEHI